LYDFQRATIGAVFGCPIGVEYGCRDGGTVANECPAGGLHIAAEGMIVEVIDGEIVLTNLHTFAMPIIRYRTGDVGALEPTPCSCGRGLPRLRGVEGRQTDFLVTPSGKILHALAAIYVLRELPSVAEFQIGEERGDALTIRVVPRDAFGPAEQSAVRSRLRRLFESDIDVVFEVMDTLPRLASGKHRYVISEIAAEHCRAV